MEVGARVETCIFFKADANLNANLNTNLNIDLKQTCTLYAKNTRVVHVKLKEMS